MASDYLYETVAKILILTFPPLLALMQLPCHGMWCRLVLLGLVFEPWSEIPRIWFGPFQAVAPKIFREGTPNQESCHKNFLDVIGGRSNDFFRVNGQVLEKCCSLILPGLFMATGLLMARCPFCYSWLLRRPVGSQAGRSDPGLIVWLLIQIHRLTFFEDATLRSIGYTLEDEPI